MYEGLIAIRSTQSLLCLVAGFISMPNILVPECHTPGFITPICIQQFSVPFVVFVVCRVLEKWTKNKVSNMSKSLSITTMAMAATLVSAVLDLFPAR